MRPALNISVSKTVSFIACIDKYVSEHLVYNNDDDNESNVEDNNENDGVVPVETQDFDGYRKTTYLERLYCNILSQHHGHNKGQTLKR